MSIRVSRPFQVALFCTLLSTTLSGCSGLGGSPAEKLADQAREAAETMTDRYVVEYGVVNSIDPTSEEAIYNDGREVSEDPVERAWIKDRLDANLYWDPKIELKVDNARVVGERYLCVDIDASNNIPPVLAYEEEYYDEDGEKQVEEVPYPVGDYERSALYPGGLLQFVDLDGEEFPEETFLKFSPMVEDGHSELTYVPGTTELKGGFKSTEKQYAALLVERVNRWEEYSRAAGSDIIRMPAGGSVRTTQCWSRTPYVDTAFYEDEELKLPEAHRGGAFGLSIGVKIGRFHSEALVPFGMAEGEVAP